MSNSINNLSPDFRDFLLSKNLVADTIIENGYSMLLSNVGKPTTTSTSPISVQQGQGVSGPGQFYKEDNIVQNKYLGTVDDYNQVNIVYTNSSITNQTGPYNISQQSVALNSDDFRFSNTKFNLYLDEEKQTLTNLNTISVPTVDNFSSYLDENGSLNIGGPSTEALDILNGVLRGQGVGFNVADGSFISNGDIRASLGGRILGSTGIINDTNLGKIGAQQLLTHVGYNAAFGLQQETIGNINLNPLTLIQGKPLINLNYQITTPKRSLGKVLNFAANVFGVQSPLSLLEESIFSFNDKGEYISVSNIEMANRMILNSGRGQVQSLFNNLRANTVIPNKDITTFRQGYRPGYNDDRVSSSENTGDGLNPQLYARDNGNGSLIDFLSGSKNTPITSGNYERSEQIKSDGWDKNYFGSLHYSTKGLLYVDAFGWVDNKRNKDTNEFVSEDDLLIPNPTDKDKKTLLYKTQELFKTGNMRTIVSGHGEKVNERSQINSAVYRNGNLISKGSGVINSNLIINEPKTDDNGNLIPVEAENVFCRTWTTYDRYSQVKDLQKKRGLSELDGNYDRRNVDSSVLGDNGFVKISPYGNVNNDIKNYMFSIENLAWSDDLDNLLPCEIGPGDPVSGKRGRIMWFPPYDISFNETTSVNWDKHNFIGRGEPVYTYNNTERSGTLQWKIIIDHPNYINLLNKNNSRVNNEFITSFFAGCLSIEDMKPFLTENELAQTTVINRVEKESKQDTPVISPTKFNVYFPNDSFSVEGQYEGYEDGKIKNCNVGDCNIDYDTNETGEGEGLDRYTEQCFRYVNDKGQKVWSSLRCSKATPAGSEGREQPDRTNFGLNNIPVKIGNKTFENWKDPNYHAELKKIFKQSKSLTLTIVGYASSSGTIERNIELSKLRAEYVKEYLKTNVFNDFTDEEINKRLKSTVKGGGVAEGVGCKCLTGDTRTSNDGRLIDVLGSQNDTICCKEDRYVSVEFEDDVNLKSEIDDEVKLDSQGGNLRVPEVALSRFYTECDYFNKLSEDDPFVYTQIKDKIKYFQPAYHSTTPEGFNSRLTFLQQCTRQGSTNSLSDDNKENKVDNLAFGRPPVCILRLGDFYHTRIIIESISFSFDPLVWDLNPEGVGVQPMICTVDMSFNFIGGSSLNGPISKLQNAVSFNYYANTEIYDRRADTIGDKGDGSGYIIDGVKKINQELKGDKPFFKPDKNQTKDIVSEQTIQGLSSSDDESNVIVNDELIFRESLNSGEFYIIINYDNLSNDLKGLFKINSFLSLSLSKDYDATLVVYGKNGYVDLLNFKVNSGESDKPSQGVFSSTADGVNNKTWLQIFENSVVDKNQGTIVFGVKINEFNILFTKEFVKPTFDCPNLNITTKDIITVGEWVNIFKPTTGLNDDVCTKCFGGTSIQPPDFLNC